MTHKSTKLNILLPYITSIPAVMQSINIFCSNAAVIKLKNSSLSPDIIYNILQSLLITGNCILNEHKEILSLNKLYYINEELYYMNKKITNFLHLKYIDLKEDNWGSSPLEAAIDEMDIYMHINNYLSSIMKHGGRKSGFLFTEQPMGEDVKRKIQQTIKTFYESIPTQPSVLVLDHQLKWENLILTPAELKPLDIEERIERRIGSLLGIPPAVLGIIDTTYNNYDIALRQFIHHSILPLLKRIIHKINLFYQSNITIMSE